MGLKMTLDSLKLSLAPEGCQTSSQQGMTYAKSGGCVTSSSPLAEMLPRFCN
jgi:hypothetical protein